METTLQQLTVLRHSLHQHPEISGDEKETAGRIFSFLEKLNTDSITRDIGGHGILVLFDSGKPGPTLLFRSELDALPIQEINEFEYRSETAGVAHKCGHDGHATILCGLAEKLSKNKPDAGKVYLLFQPAEETGEGAQQVINDSKFTITPDYVFALHNLPGYDAGTIVVKEGLFSAAVNSIVIKLIGKTAHAAEPEMGFNPANAISEIIILAGNLSNNNPADKNFSVVTPIHINMGKMTYGTSAGEGELHYTLRCWNNENLAKLENDLIEGSKVIAEKYNLDLASHFTQTFLANNNNKEATAVVKAAAKKMNFNLLERDVPFKWGEDFGYFTSNYKGCMFGVGAGVYQPALHNPDYDFPDEIIDTGVNMFYTITNLLLNK